jgi:signal transduction histidine kinase
LRDAASRERTSDSAPRLTFARMAGIGAALAVLVPLLFAALIARNHREMVRKTTEVDRRQNGLALANELERMVIEMETAVRGFRNTGQEEFLDPYREAVERHGRVSKDLGQTLPAGAERSIFSEVSGRIERWRSGFAEPRIAFLRLHPPRFDGGHVLLADLPSALEPAVGKLAMDGIRRDFRSLEALQKSAVTRNLNEMTKEQAGLSRLLWSTAASFSLLLLVTAAWLGTLYRKRMGILFTGIAAAEAGTYGPVSLAGADEPARIAAAFNRMVREVEQRDDELRRRLDVERRLTEERGRAYETLEAAHKELEAFSYSVSHDLRAPLRHITGFAELLTRRAAGTLDDRAQRLLVKISDSARQMGQLVDDLLVFSRMRQSGMSPADVPLAAMVEGIRGDLEASGEAKDVSWDFDGLPMVRADPPMLRMALMNLMSNAVKYSGGRTDPRVEIGSFTEGKETVVFVRDNGVGFDPRYAHKLFGVFQRLHAAEDFEGTGIGLANVRRIIERHGGRTWAEGAVGAGATFYFSLPLSEERHA